MGRRKKQARVRHLRTAADPRTRRGRLAQTLTDFAMWYDRHAGGEDIPSDVAVEVLRQFFDSAPRDGVGVEPTAFDPDALTHLVEFLNEIADDDDGGYAIIETLHSYLHFLSDEERWTGPPDDLDACLGIVHDAVDAAPDGLSLLLKPLEEIDDLTRRDAVDRTVIVRAVPDLLGWIGRSRQVTASGLLRRADIEPVAAMIGLRIRGRRRSDPPYRPEALVGLFDDESPTARDHEIPYVNSMLDSVPLHAWWQALLDIGIIETTVTTVRPGPRVSDWESADAAAALALHEDLVGRYLSAIVHAEAAPRYGPDFFALTAVQDLLSHLALALRPDIEPDTPSADLLSGSVDENPLGRIAHLRTPGAMRWLETVGLVRIVPVGDDERYVVPEGLRPAVAAAIQRTAIELDTTSEQTARHHE